MPLAGYGRGVLVESHMGRPTKIEGNPLHPASLGATDVFMQASILGSYDPDRSQVLTNAGRIGTWNAFFAAVNGELEAQRLNQGAGSAILTEDRDLADARFSAQAVARKISQGALAPVRSRRRGMGRAAVAVSPSAK